MFRRNWDEMGVNKGALLIEGHDSHILGRPNKAVGHQHPLRSALYLKTCSGAERGPCLQRRCCIFTLLAGRKVQGKLAAASRWHMHSA